MTQHISRIEYNWNKCLNHKYVTMKKYQNFGIIVAKSYLN